MERSLKILIFINSLSGGGAERVAATLANHWASARWDVTVVTLASQNEDFYPLDQKVRRMGLNLFGDSANVVDGLRQNFHRVMALRQIIKQLRPDIALGMMSTPSVLLALACIGVSGVRTIGSEHCYPPRFPLGRMWHALRRHMYGRLGAVAALTQESAVWISRNSFARRVPVIPNPVSWPLPIGQPRILPDKVCQPQRKIMLAVGRLSKEKGFEALIQVFSGLVAKHPDWDLVILGEGPERNALEAQMREASADQRIFLPGIVGNVGEWYARADLCAMSSFYEGFPNALAEALAYGVPAVSFDCDTGPRDIIRDGVDGLLVTAENTQELQDTLDRMMGDAELRKRLALRACDARERFSTKRIADMWEGLFRDLLNAECTPQTRPAKAANKEGIP